jgi:hypothetical protein
MKDESNQDKASIKKKSSLFFLERALDCGWRSHPGFHLQLCFGGSAERSEAIPPIFKASIKKKSSLFFLERALDCGWRSHPGFHLQLCSGGSAERSEAIPQMR